MLLENSGQIYSSNAYLVLGDWSRISDVNTLVDVGRDPAVLDALERAPTGVGKQAVEQVVLTHGHYDHVELLNSVRARFSPAVCAFASGPGIDRTLPDGASLKIGDDTFEVLHTPGHSSDSICLYCPNHGVLFAGDTPLLLRSSDGTYEEGYVAALEKICARDIRTIYFGHGPPCSADCNIRLRHSLEIVSQSITQLNKEGEL